ncbi:MAG: stage II sporulation protein M [Verrucomicrobiales bacterium]|nr:stage II sporulation protein M [Verrucomicrobiales bacterium]
MILDLDQFVSKERPYWDELTGLLQKQDDQPDWKMSLEEARRFHYLYHRASSDLVKLKNFAGEVEASLFLENLVARSYSRLHERRGSTIPFRPVHWLLRVFPATFRRHWIAFVISFLSFFIGGVFGAGIMKFTPEHKTHFIGPFTHLAGKPSDRVAREESQDFDGFANRSTFSAQLMQNNIRVTILAMVIGFFFGILTIFLLFYNGIGLGLIIYDYIADGQGEFLTGWLLPHGSVEIPAIILGGQAGLIIAHAMFGWGTNLRLAQRFRRIRSDLLTIVGGAALLLVWAGLVESFLSQYHGPDIYPFKIAFGTIQLTALACFLLFAGRTGKNPQSTTYTVGSPELT